MTYEYECDSRFITHQITQVTESPYLPPPAHTHITMSKGQPYYKTEQSKTEACVLFAFSEWR